MNHLIITSDNNIGYPDNQPCLEDYAESAETLKKLAEHTLQEMKNDNPNLLVFPQDLYEYGDKIGDEHIFEIKDNKLVTGNIMGFIGHNNTKVRIRSRFDTGDKDYFLHYMLQKVFAINLFDLNYNIDEEDIFDFLIYLFPTFLRNALRQGLYKEYQTRKYNDSNVKGRIDVNRHIQRNIPFNGRVAYSTREYVYDNHVTQLIRHTIEYISRHRFQGEILRANEDIKEAVREIIDATPTYNRNERLKIINQNLRPIYHPYYREYRDLQRLCLHILRHEEIKYGSDDDQIYGVLFDGAWLWEEYLNIILKECGFTHPQNKISKGKIYLFKDGSCPRYPDFYKEDFVLDAKYKGYENTTIQNVDGDDLHQVITYMYRLKASQGGFVVPFRWNEELSQPKELSGYGGKLGIYGLRVEYSCPNYQQFVSLIQRQEDILKKHIISIV